MSLIYEYINWCFVCFFSHSQLYHLILWQPHSLATVSWSVHCLFCYTRIASHQDWSHLFQFLQNPTESLLSGIFMLLSDPESHNPPHSNMAYYGTLSTKSQLLLRSMVILCIVFSIGSKVAGKPTPMDVSPVEKMSKSASTAVHNSEEAHLDGEESQTSSCHSSWHFALVVSNFS